MTNDNAHCLQSNGFIFSTGNWHMVDHSTHSEIQSKQPTNIRIWIVEYFRRNFPLFLQGLPRRRAGSNRNQKFHFDFNFGNSILADEKHSQVVALANVWMNSCMDVWLVGWLVGWCERTRFDHLMNSQLKNHHRSTIDAGATNPDKAQRPKGPPRWA